MENLYIDLNLTPSGVSPRLHLSQYDKGRKVECTLYADSTALIIPEGSLVTVEGTKADNKGFQYECEYEGDKVIFTITEQMSMFEGEVEAEIVIYDGENRYGTANFVLDVEVAGLQSDVEISKTDLPIIEQLPAIRQEMQEAVEEAVAAKDEVLEIKDSAIEIIETEKDKALEEIASDLLSAKGEMAVEKDLSIQAIESAQVEALSDISTEKTTALNEISAAKTDATDTIATDKADAIGAITTTKEEAIASLDGFVTEAESFAHGGTGTREGEDIDNSSYYAQKSKEYMEQAKSIVDVGFASDTHSGLAKGDGETIHANGEDGGKLSLTEKYATHPDNEISTENGVHGLRYNAETETLQRWNGTEWEDAGAKIDIDAEMSDESENPAQNKVVKAYIDGEIDRVELFKFPNATIVGQPTINNGQISGFSETNYLRFPFIVNFQGRPFEINVDFTTGEGTTAQQNIFDSDFGFAFAVRSGKLVIAISSNGSSWDIGEGVGTYAIAPNTSYKVKLSWNGTEYKVAISTDGGDSYIDDITIASALSPYPKQVYIGVGENNGVVFNHFDGIINFNFCNLIISDKLVWQGMDDVGLASRLAVDLGNLDEAGRAKIENIVEEYHAGETFYDNKVHGLSYDSEKDTLLLTTPEGEEIEVGGGGGMSAELIVTAPENSTTTISKGATVYTHTETSFTQKIKDFGSWELSTTNGERTATATVEVLEVKPYEVTLKYFGGKIDATYPEGAVCTCEKGEKVLTAPDTSGHALFTLNEGGEWTLKITKEGEDEVTQIVNVAEEIIYYTEISFLKIVTWADGTDEEIVKMVKASERGSINLQDYWNVGDERKMTLSAMGGIEDAETHAEQEVTWVLMNKGGKILADGNECEFVVGMKDCLAETGKMNTVNTNVGGWKETPRRTWCNTTFKNAIPSTISEIFKEYKTITSKGGTIATAKATGLDVVNDYFGFPAEMEVFGVGKYSATDEQVAYGSSSQWEWYKTSSNRIKYRNGSAFLWWESSSSTDGSSAVYFCVVSGGGGANGSSASYDGGLAPVGCIGSSPFTGATLKVTHNGTCTVSDGTTTLQGSGSPETFNIPTGGLWEITVTNENGTEKQYVNVAKSGEVIERTVEVIKIVSWSTGSDADIVAMVQAADEGKINLADYWEIGQERTMTLSAMGTITGIDETHQSQTVSFVLMDKDKYELVTPVSGRNKCSFVVGQKHCLNTAGKMNTNNTNVGGWRDAPRRTWCNEIYYNAIPSTLRGIFKKYKRLTSNGNTTSSRTATGTNVVEDFFGFPAEMEVFGTRNYSATDEANEYGSTSQLEWYKTPSNRIKYRDGSAYYWWESSSSAAGSGAIFFCIVDSNGNASDNGASNSRGLAPVGCI